MIRIGFSHGDINGIGYEILLKTFTTEEMFEICTPVVYGSHKVAEHYCQKLELQPKIQVKNSADEITDGQFNLIECFEDKDLTIEEGTVTEESKLAAKLSLERTIQDLKTGKIDAMVSLPTQGVSINVTELQVCDDIRMVTLDTNEYNEKFAETLNKTLLNMQTTLSKDFLIDSPRIAVLSSTTPVPEETSTQNATEGEHLEDSNTNPVNQPNDNNREAIIAECVNESFRNKNLCFGPYNAKYFCGQGHEKHFDGILFCDAEAAKELEYCSTMDSTFYYSMGLPVVIVSPRRKDMLEHVGEGIASETSLRNAIYTAVDATRNRRFYDKARANVLRRMYYEKRDDSDKLKLD